MKVEALYSMNEELIKNADACYRLAYEKAVQYFKSLYVQVEQKSYVDTLTKDFQEWKKDHIQDDRLLTSFLFKKKKTAPEDYHNYIQWLNRKGKLDSYLDRSVSYIFMRDLGKALDSPDTKIRVRREVDLLKKHLTFAPKKREDKTEQFSMIRLYRHAEKEGIEATFIWLIDKLKTVSSKIPEGIDALQAKRKLIKIIAGVIMHQVEEMDEKISPNERKQKLDEAIRLGYSYGLTYPFIDDLLDSKVLSTKEKEQYSTLIRTTLITGSVPELGEWAGNNRELIQYIHSELREAFEYIKDQQKQETIKSFFEQSYLFFHSQEVDRKKELANANYTNEELYIPVILKAASSRLIIRSVISAPKDEGFEDRTFFYGLYNQLADDFTDMFDDLDNNAVTPYTYYLKYQDKRHDLINPFELYWAVINHLIHNVYHSDTKTREVILDRAINGLKRFKKRMGTRKYNEVMTIFTSGIPVFNRLIQKMVQKADNVDFFDKLLRDHIIKVLKKEENEQEAFLSTVEDVRKQINSLIILNNTDSDFLMEEPITEAANYSLKGNGKRLRPIVTWMMGVNEYGLNKTAIVPLLKSLEYMHTASLIFDDLPSQDNAATRRGRPTLHQVKTVAIAELTGLFLTQKAIEEQASLDKFDTKSVLNLIQYSAKTTANVCKGQAIDLDSKGKQLSLEQLNMMSFYKTGIAFEASLVMPAILARAKESEIHALKKFAYHAGIAFQIKDDLLDHEGDVSSLGKPIGQDAKNNNSTFVTILGFEGAKKAMWGHYCLAMDALQEVPRNISFLKNLMNYIINRSQ